MKIAIICGYFPISLGGAEYQSYLLAKHLAKTNRVYLLPILTKTDIVEEKELMLFPIYKRKILRRIFNRYFILDYCHIHRILRRIDPDVIYQRVGFAYTGIAAKYARQYRKKMIWHISSVNDVTKPILRINRNFLPNFIDKKCLEYGIRNADCIICQTYDQRKLLALNYNRNANFVIPNFHPKSSKIIKKGSLVKILWIAHLKTIKQPKYFLDLAEKFGDKKNVRFIMIGKSSEKSFRDLLKNYTTRLDNFDYIREKSIEEVNTILCDSHILINTSKSEGFPNTFIQAWLRKVPVVSLNVDPDSVLKNFKLGFHSKSFSQMVMDVQTLIQNQKMRNEMGKRAQQYALKKHNFENNIKKMAKIINNLNKSETGQS